MVQLFRWKDRGADGQEKLKTYAEFSKKEQQIINSSPDSKAAEHKMMMLAHCEREASYWDPSEEGVFESSEITEKMVRSGEGTLGSGTYFSDGTNKEYSGNSSKKQFGYTHVPDNHWDNIFGPKKEMKNIQKELSKDTKEAQGHKKSDDIKKILDAKKSLGFKEIKWRELPKFLKQKRESFKNKFFN